jgi:hypothetical protein
MSWRGGASTAFTYARRLAAVAAVGGWLGLNAYWFVSGETPDCQVTTVTRPPDHTAVTQISRCGLPDPADYVYVLGFAAICVIPDADEIGIGSAMWKRRQTARAAGTAMRVELGDTPDDAENLADLAREVEQDGT